MVRTNQSLEQCSLGIKFNQRAHAAEIENHCIINLATFGDLFNQGTALGCVMTHACTNGEGRMLVPFNVYQFDPVTTEEIPNLRPGDALVHSVPFLKTVG